MKRALQERGITLDEDAPERLLVAHADAEKLALLDAKHMEGLRERAGTDVPMVQVPELPSDVYDVRLLAKLAAILTG